MHWVIVLVLAPLEVVGCALVGAWRGLVDGCRNVRDALGDAI